MPLSQSGVSADGQEIGRLPLDDAGRAVLTVADLAAGERSISAAYSGPPRYTASSARPLTLTVDRATTRLSLSGPVGPVPVGQASTLLATIAVEQPGGGTPAGAVMFRSGTTELERTALDSSGIARLTLHDLAPGDYQLVAEYAGNANFAPSTTTPFVLQVRAQLYLPLVVR